MLSELGAELFHFGGLLLVRQRAVGLERLVLSWADPDDLKDKSRVTFEIEALEDMTCLTVTHGNFKDGSTMVKKVSGGWPRVLSSLKTFLETGKGLNIFCK